MAVSGGKFGVVGRERELGRIAEGLDDGGTLLLHGEAGIGKATVWRSGLDEARARGFQTLAATPVLAEQTFAYGVLADLLAGVEETAIATLPPPQQRRSGRRSVAQTRRMRQRRLSRSR